ncbi:MAG: methylated-DNA--[protein]-cysteine S-methyltransferase [Gammaproteobacteria bacterium]|jgi:methylated-DNA-[protein]-cysteine S-methyltransferase
MKILESSVYPSPIGDMQVVTAQDKLCYLDFADNKARMHQLLKRRFGGYKIVENAKHQQMHAMLDKYFEGKSDAFQKLELDTGGTDFQRKVWNALQKIPRGKTMDYSTLAKHSGNEKAVRAAASSNARNPVSIVIPCHRVIGKDGSLRGYAGGEHRKRWLLEHEGAIVDSTSQIESAVKNRLLPASS